MLKGDVSINVSLIEVKNSFKEKINYIVNSHDLTCAIEI